MENNWMDLVINVGTWLGFALAGFALGLKYMARKEKEPPGMYCTLLKNGRVIMTPEEYRDSTLHDLLWQDGLLRRLLPPV